MSLMIRSPEQITSVPDACDFFRFSFIEPRFLS